MLHFADYLLAVTLLSALMTLIVMIEARRAIRRLRWEPPDPPTPLPAELITAIMPARNEAADVEAALRSVLAERQLRLEVLLVNDHSTDATGPIAERVAAADPRLRVLHDPPLRPGWLGKCNAMQAALEASSGQYVLLTDADVIHGPGCLRAALAEMQRSRLDLLSLFPRMECVSLWEHVLLPMSLAGVATLGPAGIERDDSPEALAAGAFILVRRATLESLGGFERVKNQVLDDVSLAREFKRAGLRVRLRDAARLLRVRLFKGNRHAFWGPTKNVLGVIGEHWWRGPLGIGLTVLVYWSPPAALCAGLWQRDPRLLTAAVGTLALQYALALCGRALFDFSRLKAWAFPLLPISVSCCIAAAMYYHLVHGAVRWRSRVIRVRTGEG